MRKLREQWREPNLESSFYPWKIRRLAEQAGFRTIKQDYLYQWVKLGTSE